MIHETVIDQIKPGANVRVFEAIVEVDDKGKEKKRTSRFEGLVLARKHGSEAGASFTVRSVVGGVGVEKIFPIFSPSIDKVEIVSAPAKVKRSKLYYLRDVSRKVARRKLGSVYRRDRVNKDTRKKTVDPANKIAEQMAAKEDAPAQEKEIEKTADK